MSDNITEISADYVTQLDTQIHGSADISQVSIPSAISQISQQVQDFETNSTPIDELAFSAASLQMAHITDMTPTDASLSNIDTSSNSITANNPAITQMTQDSNQSSNTNSDTFNSNIIDELAFSAASLQMAHITDMTPTDASLSNTDTNNSDTSTSAQTFYDNRLQIAKDNQETVDSKKAQTLKNAQQIETVREDQVAIDAQKIQADKNIRAEIDTQSATNLRNSQNSSETAAVIPDNITTTSSQNLSAQSESNNTSSQNTVAQENIDITQSNSEYAQNIFK